MSQRDGLLPLLWFGLVAAVAGSPGKKRQESVCGHFGTKLVT